MFPEIFAVGPFSLRTMSVFLVLAFLATSFIFWRRGREEHYAEDQLFDAFLLSLLFGMLVSRVAFVILNFENFGLNILGWLDIFSRPGFDTLAGIVGGGIYLKRYGQANKWDNYEILDLGVTAMSLGGVFFWIGRFFEGTNVGSASNLPWAVQFPNLIEPHHPIQLYFAIFYLLLFWYLSWVEYHYRTFSWYKTGKRAAQTGFIVSMFVILSSVFSLIMTWFRPVDTVVFGINVNRLLYFATTLYGLLLLYIRSGRSLPFGRKDRKTIEPNSDRVMA